MLSNTNNEKKITYFTDSKGNPSMMRLKFSQSVNTARIMALIVTFGSVIALLLGIYLDRNITLISTGISALLGSSSILVGTFLIPAFGGKSVQKFAENKNQE